MYCYTRTLDVKSSQFEVFTYLSFKSFSIGVYKKFQFDSSKRASIVQRSNGRRGHDLQQSIKTTKGRDYVSDVKTAFSSCRCIVSSSNPTVDVVMIGVRSKNAEYNLICVHSTVS